MFTTRADFWLRSALAVTGVLSLCLLSLIWVLPSTAYNTQVGLTPTQPVPFSHKHHVSGLGIDCRYCHDSVETASNAGMPATHTCMTCHSQIWTNA